MGHALSAIVGALFAEAQRVLKGLVVFGLTRRPIILLALLVFVAAGIVAFFKLDIEAYPNPAPVILEITAQAAGQSAEEMERYYTIPMEVGLSTTPGVDVIRSTSFYGLSFVRVTFNYGIDYYFAVQQAALSLQQNVSLPNNVSPQIQASSLVGEVFRYQVVGPPHFGLTNLRTIQDWVLQRRFLTVPGVVQVNTWGGTTIGANLPNWVLISPFSGWFAEVTLNVSRGGAQCLGVGLGDNRVDDRLMIAWTIRRRRRHTPFFTRPPGGESHRDGPR